MIQLFSSFLLQPIQQFTALTTAWEGLLVVWLCRQSQESVSLCLGNWVFQRWQHWLPPPVLPFSAVWVPSALLHPLLSAAPGSHHLCSWYSMSLRFQSCKMFLCIHHCSKVMEFFMPMLQECLAPLLCFPLSRLRQWHVGMCVRCVQCMWYVWVLYVMCDSVCEMDVWCAVWKMVPSVSSLHASSLHNWQDLAAPVLQNATSGDTWVQVAQE